MDIVRMERAMQALLSEVMGAPATGALLARSTGATGTLPAGAFAVPVALGVEEHGAVYVDKNPVTADGSWPITEAGTLVPVTAMQGGVAGNRPVGVPFKWFPGVDGIVVDAVSSVAFTGGVPDGLYGSLKQLRSHKQFDAEKFKTFYAAGLGEYPGAVLCFNGLTPLDGPTFASPGSRSARVGAKTIKYKLTWELYLVCSRLDSKDMRRSEGHILLQRVCETLFGRTGTRNAALRVSGDPGIQINSAGIHDATPNSYVDLVRFESVATLSTKTPGDGANPWRSSRIDVYKRAETETQADISLPDTTISMLYPEE